MKITIEKIDNRWLVNKKRLQDMSNTEKEILNTFFKNYKHESRGYN